MTKYEIINFKNEYSKLFYDLNIEWLNEFFLVEDYDKKILSNPQKYIIKVQQLLEKIQKKHFLIIETLC